MVRQLLTESMLISIAGGLLGSVLALWSFQALVALALPALLPPELPAFASALDLSPDFRVLSFAMALTLGTGILFGLAPALHVSKPDLLSRHQAGLGGRRQQRRGGRLRGTLVGVQVALCMTLMIAAGLLLRGLYATYTVDPGFAYRDVAYVSFGLDGLPYEAEAAAIFRQRLIDEVEALPGVDAVAYASDPPLGEETARRSRSAFQGESENQIRVADLNAVTPGYFSVLGTSDRARTYVHGGRDRERGAARHRHASRHRQRNNRPQPLARRRPDRPDAADHGRRHPASRRRGRGCAGHDARSDRSLLRLRARRRGRCWSRADVDFGATASSIHRIVRALDPTLVVRVLPLEANLGWWRGVSGTVATLGAGLGALALVLASVGIYGVVSYSVTRRYREIGIRMALGASARNVLGMILRQTMRPVVVGAVIGVAAASALCRAFCRACCSA